MPTQFEPHTWDQHCAQNAQVNNKFEMVVFLWETTWENQWKIYFSARYKVEWPQPFIRIQIWYLLAFAYYAHKLYELKGKTDGDGESWRKQKKERETEIKNDRQPIFGYGDCFVANGLMFVYFVFNFVAFNIDM